MYSQNASTLLAEVAEKATQLYTENEATRHMLLEQIQMFEALLNDKTGREIAYRRMHHINSLLKEIENFTQSKNYNKIQDVIIDMPYQMIHGKYYYLF